MPRPPRFIATALVVALLPLGGCLAGCMAGLSRQFSPRVLFPSRRAIASPADLSLPFVAVSFRSASGRMLKGWYLPNTRTSAGVLVCNGNTGNMSYHLLYARILWRAGFSVLLFDYQGFGRSPGRASLLSLADDGRAALKFLRSQREVDPRRVGIFGISLGSVVALAVAAQCPGQVAAVAAEAPYDPRQKLTQALIRRRKYKPWKARLTAGLIAGFAFPAHFRPFESIARLTGVPVFLLHGADDGFLPATTSLRLFLKASGPKRLWLPERTGHSPELLVTQDGEYQAQLTGFFSQWLGRRSVRRRPGFRWRVRHYRGGRFDVLVRLGVRFSKPTPVELITIPPSGETFSRHRIWVSGDAPILLRPRRVPVAIAYTPRLGPVRRAGWTWRPRATLYTRSYRRLKAARPRVSRLLRRGRAGLAHLGRLLSGLDSAPLDARIQPLLGRMFARYGARLQSVGRLRQAERAYVRALVLAPANPRTFYELGAARFSYGALRYPVWVRRRLDALRSRQPRRP